MMQREFIYSKLASIVPTPHPPYPDIDPKLFTERVFSASALTEVPDEEMFIVYRMSTDESWVTAEDQDIISHQVANIWVYDRLGDYERIEVVQRFLIKPVLLAYDPNPEVGRCEFGLHSEDLQDDVWKRASRFSRYHLYWPS